MILPASITSLNLPDDLVVAGEDDRRVPQASRMIHVDAHAQRLFGGFRAIHREHGEELLDG